MRVVALSIQAEYRIVVADALRIASVTLLKIVWLVAVGLALLGLI